MTTQVQTQTRAPITVASLISQASFKEQLKAVLPQSLTPERMVRIAVTELRMNPKLAECDPMSFAGALLRCAQMGLEPSSERQHVHLIPFRNNQANRVECQVIVGYRGYLSLAAESNIYIESGVVYENDFFEFQLGIETKCKFIPCMDGDRGVVKGAYAMARVCLPDGTIVFVPEFIPVSDINKIMASSKGATRSDSPWKTNYEPMCRKSAIRRLFKYLPMSPKIEAAVTIDELADRDAQNNTRIVSDIVDSGVEEKPMTGADNLMSRIAPKDKEPVVEPEMSLAEQLTVLIAERNVAMEVTQGWLNDAKVKTLGEMSEAELMKCITIVHEKY